MSAVSSPGEHLLGVSVTVCDLRICDSNSHSSSFIQVHSADTDRFENHWHARENQSKQIFFAAGSVILSVIVDKNLMFSSKDITASMVPSSPQLLGGEIHASIHPLLGLALSFIWGQLIYWTLPPSAKFKIPVENFVIYENWILRTWPRAYEMGGVLFIWCYVAKQMK